MSAILNMNFVILDHPRSQLWGSITLSNLVPITTSPPEILRFYNFASLAGKCLTTPPFWFFGGFEPLKIVGRHPNTQKARPWVTTRHLCHKQVKIRPGVRPGRSCEKKV